MNNITAEKCREQFESWWEKFHETSPRETWSVLYSPEHDYYVDGDIDGQYDAWKASRQALEIALTVLEQQESKQQVSLKEGVSALRKLTEESGGYNFEALHAEQVAGTCTWSFVDSNFAWSSSCGEEWQFMEGGPEENRVKFCHYCGGKVIINDPQPSTTPQIDNDGWIEWKGDGTPVDDNVFVAVKWRNDAVLEDRAYAFAWYHDGSDDDIIAYRVIENDGREG